MRLSEGYLYPPEGSSWGDVVYVVVFPKVQNVVQEQEENQIHYIPSICDNKRKGDDIENPGSKTRRMDKKRCVDLIVLGLPWKSTEEDMRKYFSQFGELLLVQVKRDGKTGQSKGFGFVRFGDFEAQSKCLAQRHMIDGRWCEVNIPASNEQSGPPMNRKVFIARCSEDITADDLHKYFSKFGEVSDVFIPKPFRAFAFVTFMDAEIAQSLCGEDHIIKGTSVHVSSATPKSFGKYEDQSQGGRERDGRRDRDRGDYDRLRRRGDNNTTVRNETAMDQNMGMNFLNSAMLAAAQAVLSGQGGWPGMGGTQQPGASQDQTMAQSYRGTSRPDSGGQSYTGWGYDSQASTQGGGYSGWSGRGGAAGGWS